MPRKRPTARDVERGLEEAVNAIVAAWSDAARWAANAPAAEFAGRHRVDQLLAEALAKHEEALRIVRLNLRAAPQRHPRPPAPLGPGAA